MLKSAWTIIEKVNPVASLDENGKPFTQRPKIWASVKQGGGSRPATVLVPGPMRPGPLQLVPRRGQ